MRLSDFIERSNAAGSVEQLFGHFQAAVSAYGYDRICFAAATPPAQHSLDSAPTGPALAIKCPDDWVKHYLQNRYHEFDPVLLTAPVRRRPFFWNQLLACERLSAKQKHVLNESADAGMRNGLTIPIHGPRGESFLISLAGDGAAAEIAPHLGQLHLLSTQFYIAFSDIGGLPNDPVDDVRLTERERECLSWTARGKSAWAISMILGVSEHTINFYLKSAMKKLGTTNRVQAVAQGVRMGLIAP